MAGMLPPRQNLLYYADGLSRICLLKIECGDARPGMHVQEEFDAL